MSSYSLTQIKKALEQCWSKETSYCGSQWTKRNPARGQCAVSALVVQDYLGGEIKRVQIHTHQFQEKHYINVLPNGQVHDVTRSQYPDQTKMIESDPDLSEHDSIRQKLLADPSTKKRYQILGSQVARQLARAEMEAR